MESKTAIWYQKREKLTNGPTIPKSFLDTPYTHTYRRVHDLCSATLNRSHVMLIFASTDPLINKVVIFDTVKKFWYLISDLQLEYDSSFNHCGASVTNEKSGKK